jgi:hypothetical protein
VSNTNSVIPYTGAKLKELADTIGITQFPDETSWYQVLGGLIFQGGKVSAAASAATTVVDFPAPYPTQALGVWLQVSGAAGNNADVTISSLDSFNLNNGVGIRDYYWWSVGV